MESEFKDLKKGICIPTMKGATELTKNLVKARYFFMGKRLVWAGKDPKRYPKEKYMWAEDYILLYQHCVMLYMKEYNFNPYFINLYVPEPLKILITYRGVSITEL